MKRKFNAVVWKEGKWFVAQCLEVDVASQGRTEQEALENLREALELYFEEPQPTVKSKVKKVTNPKVAEVEVSIFGA
ncbi:MAG: type II toxin-antitoxin system HicB family antitoxin [Armatimonadota bacterium]